MGYFSNYFGVSGGSGGGSGGLTQDQADKLDDIWARTAQIGAAQVTYTGPVNRRGTASIVQGDDYQDGRELSWSKKNYTGPDLTDATLSASLMTAAAYNTDPTAAPALTVTGSVSIVTEIDDTTTATYRVPLTAAETAALEPSPLDDPVNWVIQVRATTADGHKQTEFLVAATVERSILS